MRKIFWILSSLFLFLSSIAISAEEKKDLATGEGLMVITTGDDQTENIQFEPRYGYAYASGTGSKRQVWLLMTNQDPAGIDWSTAKDRVEVLRQWCGSKKAPFVLTELDANGTPQLVTQCPGNGALAVEMISTINGLASVQIDFQINDGKRLRGRLQGGNGTCDEMKYCEQTKDYYFDVTISE